MNRVRVRVRVRGISFLKTVNTLQVALQRYKGGDGRGRGRGGISFLKTVNTLLSESTEGRTRHKGGCAFARTVGLGLG